MKVLDNPTDMLKAKNRKGGKGARKGKGRRKRYFQFGGELKEEHQRQLLVVATEFGTMENMSETFRRLISNEYNRIMQKRNIKRVERVEQIEEVIASE